MPETLPDLVALLPSWQLALKAERKSAGTIRTYTDGVTKFLRWCDNTGTKPELTRAVVQAFLADLLEAISEITPRTPVILRDPQDAKTLATMIRTLVEKPEWRGRMGQAAAKASLEWTWDRNAMDVWDLLKDAVGKKRPAASRKH